MMHHKTAHTGYFQMIYKKLDYHTFLILNRDQPEEKMWKLCIYTKHQLNHRTQESYQSIATSKRIGH